MGSKDVRTDSGSSQPSEAGVHLRFPCCRGKTYSGFAEDLPFPGGTDGTAFVHGRGKRKSRNQRYLELFQRFQERQTVYDWHTASFQGRNNYCKTDSDATFMYMKDDHMRNAQLKPGYNVQIAVDSEYIVAVDIFQERNDVWTLFPFLKTMEEKLGFRYPSITADSGYESEEGYTYLREQGRKPYIKPQTYEKWKKR